MREKSRRAALCGMMTALGCVMLLLGGAFPAATFAAPALAGLTLLPVFSEYGRRQALAAWIAEAGLALLLSPDKEAALLFAFLGWWPGLKADLDRVRPRPLRAAVKLALFAAAAGLTLLTAVRLLGMEAILREYAEMGRAGTAAFAAAAGITMLLYDTVLARMLALYRRRLRPRLFRGAAGEGR